ncbi:cobalt-precorrin-6A reductase [Rubellimicrobium roseum]|uniref:Cobalt-precorrin-6A reductase n=1 Tax=Rubellimicrobium roseum TaxID=687525 RepID=A0A5C4N9K9_9RHOB|nr:cobalt-precorrin-6A reductase [Rubellimicrobium roseum]TNC68027.1 cobalt-precorrin-6A reductase [Rubellimicrobium roseum]
MILLLSGTSDARRLAARLAREGVPAIASLAGATKEPFPLGLPTRHGGFGGAEGFAAYLDRERITAVIDATHPFAARITARTHAVCRARGVPLLRLERAGWTPEPAWTWVADEAEAMRLLPPDSVVFLATGRQSLPAWAGLRAARVHLRVIDPPAESFPFPGGPIVARPPFDRAAESALFRDLGVTHLVAKDSGAADARPKLDAARDLGIEVILLRRPLPPEGLHTVATVEEALAWALPFRSATPTFRA